MDFLLVFAGVDVLVFYTDGQAPQYQPDNVRFERIARADVVKRHKKACDFATGGISLRSMS
jgi:hypothetical protein